MQSQPAGEKFSRVEMEKLFGWFWCMRPALLWLVLIVRSGTFKLLKAVDDTRTLLRGAGNATLVASKSRVLMTICSKLFGRVISSVAVLAGSEAEMKNCANDSKTHSCANVLWMKIPTDLYQALVLTHRKSSALQNSLRVRVNHFKRGKFSN